MNPTMSGDAAHHAGDIALESQETMIKIPLMDTTLQKGLSGGMG
jgi:hypothetical protein